MNVEEKFLKADKKSLGEVRRGIKKNYKAGERRNTHCKPKTTDVRLLQVVHFQQLEHVTARKFAIKKFPFQESDWAIFTEL